MSGVSDLLRVLDAYCAGVGQAEATVSTKFLGSGRRVADLRNGSDMASRTIARIVQKFSAEWPDGAVWPADVVRPPGNGEAGNRETGKSEAAE